MRPFRSARLLVIAALVFPLVLATVVLPTQAWARGLGNVKVNCYTLTGSWGGSWQLTCQQELVTGTFGNVAASFPTSPSIVIWSTGANPAIPPDRTTISMTTTQRTGRHDKCHTGFQEYVVRGAVTYNTETPGIKGKVKAFVCVSGGGALSLLKGKGGLAKPFKL